MDEPLPRIAGVLETVLYFRDEAETRQFYEDVLGLRPLSREPGRSLFYRAGASVFLLFDARMTRRPGGRLPPHGADGPVHTCFRTEPGDYGRWRDHLKRHGVGILGDADWERGRSFYFADPAGNLLEIADGDFWPK